MGHTLDIVGDIFTDIGKSPIGKFGHYIGDAAAIATGSPELIPFIEGGNSAASNYGKTHNIGSALKAGALSGGGAAIGSSIGGSLGSNLGSVGDLFGSSAGNTAATAGSNAFGSFLGPQAGVMAGNAISNLAGVGLGSAIGGATGQNFAGQFAPGRAPKAPPQPSPFQPAQAPASNVPGSIAGMSNLTPNQQSTGLANQGTYGGGLGPEENSYFLNLENRKLVNPNGTTNPLSSLQPIENSYLSKLGLGGYGDPTSLLQAISQWKPT